MTRITIPAACLDILGGSYMEDPPMLMLHQQQVYSWHPSEGLVVPFDMSDSIILPQSGNTLLRTLARHLNLEIKPLEPLEPLNLMYVRILNRWVLHTSGNSYPLQVPDLTHDMTQSCALAVIFVWYARVERACPHPFPSNMREYPPELERYEIMEKLPEWSVT